MTQEIIQRTLWYEGEGGRVDLHQVDLLKRSEPLVVLGEAGMGKSHLLEWLATIPEHSYCTARQLINRHDPRSLLGDGQVLVIDALDEVSAQKEGDAVDLVLRRLGELDYPRFVLSCRVADWRSATGLEAIREQYESEPLELHLKPFDDADAVAFLSASVGAKTAATVVEHFNSRGLNGMLGNPQTLELIARVVGTGNLPETRGELFESAIEVLRVEHRNTKAAQQPAREAGLDAAGSAFASLILTGNEAIVRKAAANTGDGELLLADISQLPRGAAVAAMLGTRLFKADGADRFSYWHRRVGEFLGARWLAKLADTNRKRRRLLSLFHNHGLVPASLRGLHAWLMRDPMLLPSVVNADPMGVIEYGDADNLSVEQGRALLKALEALAADNPLFRGWEPYSVRGLVQPGLVEDVRGLIMARETSFGLRLLLLQSIKEAEIARELASNLSEIVLDPEEIFAIRSAASDALISQMNGREWTSIIRSLHGYGDEMSIRLAIELIDDIGYEPFVDELIADLVIAHARKDSRTLGVLFGLERKLPDSRIEGVLESITEKANTLGKPHNREGYPELTDFSYFLVVRRLALDDCTGEKLWSWLEPFDGLVGYNRDIRKQLNEFLRNNDSLRRDVQRLVLVQQPGDQRISQRRFRLHKRSEALELTDADVVALLEAFDPANRADERWREVVLLVPHDGKLGAEVRAAAIPFAAGRSDLLRWIQTLATPPVPKWQLEDARRQRKQRAKKAMELAEHRKDFASRIESIRAGDYGVIINPAKAYLKLFSDIGDDVPAHERVAQWLGEDIAEAAHQGFEAFLRVSPMPTAREIAEAVVENQHWLAANIIVAALAERVRKRIGFDDVSDDRLMAGFFELRRSKIDDHAGIKGLEEVVETAVKSRGIWPAAMRLYHEPQLEARREHVDGLYALMRDDAHADVAAQLAAEWLERFPDLPGSPETELIERLLRSSRVEELRRTAAGRAGLNDPDRRRSWDVVGLIVDFEQTAGRLTLSPMDPNLLWRLRDLTGGRSSGGGIKLSVAQLDWVITNFRPLWPFIPRPTGVTSGDRNPWDASSYLIHLIQRLGSDFGEEAVAAIKRMREAPADHYADTIRIVAAEQARIRVEATYVPPTIEAIDAIARNLPPTTIFDLQALMVEELSLVEAKIKSDDAESWRGFYDDDGEPFPEERCRDHLLGLLRQGSEGITLEPETHVAGDKEVDITCSVGALRLPIEVKGQWHAKLWQGADRQLDGLYAQDWRAQEHGIYLVLWFGDQKSSTKRLTSPGHRRKLPQTPDELAECLRAGSNAARDGRIVVFVLDLVRS